MQGIGHKNANNRKKIPQLIDTRNGSRPQKCK